MEAAPNVGRLSGMPHAAGRMARVRSAMTPVMAMVYELLDEPPDEPPWPVLVGVPVDSEVVREEARLAGRREDRVEALGSVSTSWPEAAASVGPTGMPGGISTPATEDELAA